MVLSCGSPCIQGISDPKVARNLAIKVNDELAATIWNNTSRFGGFASLSMHDAAEAAQELRRAVTELGFLGLIILWLVNGRSIDDGYSRCHDK
jgi:2,3-dihydroxybenzoate decarboxylase